MVPIDDNRFKSFDGVELSYRVQGDGPRVLLLHGFAADSEKNWIRPHVVEALEAAGRQTIALDARGHGLSEKPHEPSAYANGAMVRDVEALLDHLDIEKIDVCGYSMGAMTTYAFVGRDARARSAVLGGVGGRLGTRTLAERAPTIAEGLLAPDPSKIEDPVARAFRAFADSTGADRRALAAIERSRSTPEERPGVPAVPTLVIAGDADVLVGSPQELADRIPGAIAKVVSGDHLSAVYDPAFRQSIVAFLAGLDQG
jgi:pimeloyl-ACP methyl ester carboxylesterase